MVEKSFAFLTLLKENNYKEWFHENKRLYDEAKHEFELFTGTMISEVLRIDKLVTPVEPKNCIFRVFRDIRFSNDKTPYKNNFGAFVAPGGGRKSEYGGYYFHLEPGRSMIGGGVWMPQPDVLKAIREEIYHDEKTFLQIISAPSFTKQFSGLSKEDVLKTAPKDFPKDWPHIDLLKYKSYTVMKSIPDEKVTGADLISEIHDVFAAMEPLNRFLNVAIKELRDNS